MTIQHFFIAVSNFKVFRFLVGGVWVKLNGVWQEAQVVRLGQDGTRYLRVGDQSFHETYNGIQDLETYK